MTPVQRFAAMLGTLAAVFRIQPDDLLIEAYWEALRDLPLDALEAGAKTLIRESRFFPRPVEWAEAAEDFLRERLSAEQTRRLALAQSTAPPLTRDDVRRLVAELAGKLGWPA